MIASLNGRVLWKSPGKAIIETGGVGFGVTMPLSTYYELPETKKKVFLLIHTHVREDAITLFGFFTAEEKDFFEKLINVSGIGPKLANNILSGASVSDLKQAILEENKTALTSIPGAGKKTAERIILELKDKIDKTESEIIRKGINKPNTDPVIMDAVSALINLGYKETNAAGAVQKASKNFDTEPWTIEQLIRKSLNLLSK